MGKSRSSKTSDARAAEKKVLKVKGSITKDRTKADIKKVAEDGSNSTSKKKALPFTKEVC